MPNSEEQKAWLLLAGRTDGLCWQDPGTSVHIAHTYEPVSGTSTGILRPLHADPAIPTLTQSGPDPNKGILI